MVKGDSKVHLEQKHWYLCVNPLLSQNCRAGTWKFDKCFFEGSWSENTHECRYSCTYVHIHHYRLYICRHILTEVLEIHFVNLLLSFCTLLFLIIVYFFHFTKVSNFIFLHFPKDTVESMVRSAQDKCPNVLSEEKVVDDVRAACLAKSQVWYRSLWR